jgi:hypothetical protein
MRNTLTYSVTLAALIAPFPALAEVSAQDVWNNWKSYMESTGYNVDAGSEDMVGSSLILRDVGLVVPSPDAQVRATIENIEMREQGDGSVLITLSDTIPFSVSASVEDAPDMEITVMLRQSGLEIVASGDPESITYDYKAQSAAMNFDRFFVEGEEVEPELDVMMTGIAGSANVQTDDMRNMSANSTVDALSASFSFVDPEQDADVSFELSMKDLVSASTGKLPLEIDTSDPTWMFTSGFETRATVIVGESSTKISAKGEESFDMSSSTDSSILSVEVSDGTVGYSVTSSGPNYTFSSPDLPFPPVNLSMDEAAFAIKFPMAKSDVAKDFQFLTRMVNLTTDDFVWSMFDPAQMLPRDPATLVIDTQGKARITADLMDPELAMDMDEEMPFEVESLKVNELSLSIAGAKIIGVGGFEFDNSDLETFDGLPAPTGNLNVDIYGINGLMDTLVAMGFLPEDQAMGTRMMMGAFTRPGDGGDHLKSEISVENGSVFANGQQLR